MFKIITSLLFGEEEVPKREQETSSVEAEDEEWHVVSHQDAVADDHQEGVMLDSHPNLAAQDAPISQQEGDSSVASPETPSNNRANEAVHALLCPPKGLAHAPLSACVQKAKAWAQRHSTSRNSIQRQNRLRQGIQQHAFPLHQPGHRNLCH